MLLRSCGKGVETGQAEEQQHERSFFGHLSPVSTMLQVYYSSQVTCTNSTCFLLRYHLSQMKRIKEIVPIYLVLMKLKSLFEALCQSMCDWCQDPLTTSLVVQDTRAGGGLLQASPYLLAFLTWEITHTPLFSISHALDIGFCDVYYPRALSYKVEE